MEIKETLESLGLSDKEAQVYLALLPVGSAPASVLGNRTGINRSTAQYICQQLAKKGLIKALEKNNTFIYSPESPDKLLYLLNLQKAALEEKEHQTNRIIGDLKAMINPMAVLPKVKFFEGADGLIEMLEDVIQENKPLYGALQLDEQMDERILDYAINVYTPKRAALKNPAKFLFNDNKLTRDYQDNDSSVNRISLLLPVKEFPFEACCHIYGDKVAFYSYRKNDLSGVLIQNPQINKLMMSIFRAAWNYARGLKKNAVYKKLEI